VIDSVTSGGGNSSPNQTGHSEQRTVPGIPDNGPNQAFQTKDCSPRESTPQARVKEQGLGDNRLRSLGVSEGTRISGAPGEEVGGGVAKPSEADAKGGVAGPGLYKRLVQVLLLLFLRLHLPARRILYEKIIKFKPFWRRN